MPVTAFLLYQFFVEADTVLLQTQMFLFHADAGVTEFVLLISKVCLALQDTDIQQRVTQAEDNITGLDLRPFFYQAFFHPAALDGIEVDDTVREHLPYHTDIIIKLTLDDGGDGQPFLVHFHGGRGIAENKVKQADQEESASCHRIQMFLLQTGFPFDRGVHVVIHICSLLLFY